LCLWVDAGDEVIEWNGRSLQGKGYEQVYEIVTESRQEAQVELIVARQATRGPPHHHSASELWRQGNTNRTLERHPLSAEQQLALLPGRPWFIIFFTCILSRLIQFDLAVHVRLYFIYI